ncbi:MAG: AarF/ABC1/UbiB kinase family protein [Myxococcota bacterium]|jgi:predicted unusual protein kinase regulating ubiquinone biosynthesis (AarF/ABC1/UbiB family)|nr:AarF/ABC1/UbiB kinase family protein [Myxococcota bacterium]
MGDQGPTSSPLRRFIKLGSLASRVGTSVAASRALDFVRSDPADQIRSTENLVKNAMRIVETLGELKGAAMKVGQMLSLHEGMLPAEVASVLRELQREAPRVPAEVMRFEVEGSLGAKIDDLFPSFDEEAFAAASIGQVHLARLEDGRRVAVKVQYPAIDQIIKADLGNLRRLFRAIFSMITELDFEPIWLELHDRLLEELDYRNEADNMRRMAELHRDVPEVVIPGVIDELSSDRVLTMEYQEGISPDEACSKHYAQEQKDLWGVRLFEFEMRGFFEHRFLHADPNMANFAFLEDGRVVVYDFGCMKSVPDTLVEGLATLFLAVHEGRQREVPQVLLEMGVYKEGEVRTPLPLDLTTPYVEIFGEIFRDRPTYRFGEDAEFYDRLVALGMANWQKATDISFPQDIIFVNRSLGGHFGNLARLHAAGPWGEIVERYANEVLDRQPAT